MGAGETGPANTTEFHDSDYRAQRPAAMKRRHGAGEAESGGDGGGGEGNATRAAAGQDDEVEKVGDEEPPEDSGTSVTTGEDESQPRPVNMPDARKGRHGLRHGGKKTRTRPSAQPQGNATDSGAPGAVMVPAGAEQHTSQPPTQRPASTSAPDEDEEAGGKEDEGSDDETGKEDGEEQDGEEGADDGEESGNASPAPSPDSQATKSPRSHPAPKQKPKPKPAPRPAPAPSTAVAPAPAPARKRKPTHKGSLPQDFERVERGKMWNTSPYVSQTRLNRLWDFLFGKYRKEIPPVPADGGPLPVGVGINFVKFKDFDEVAGTMNIALNLRLCWDDDRLSFNAREFFNMDWRNEGDKIPIRSDLVWVPDITVLNEVGELHRLLSAHGTPLVLSDDGFRNETGVNVLWSRPLDVKSNCDVDMSQYPFDEQRCYIVVGSWASSRRQMLLVPQPFFAEYTVHTSEFQVKNITVMKKDVYTRNTAQKFNEVVYCVTLQRYPHFYVINFILPMVALTLLAVSTMWMSPSNMGQRVNAGTKLLLCVVSIIFITARHRPAIHGDIWMDRFQSHCLALSMSTVLQSLLIDYLSRTTNQISWAPRLESVDAYLRAVICWLSALVIFADVCEVRRHNLLELYTSFEAESTRLLVLFVYVMFFGLILSSAWSITWMALPRRWQHKLLGKEEEKPAKDEEVKVQEHLPRKGALASLAVPFDPESGSMELGRRLNSRSTSFPPVSTGFHPRGGLQPGHWSIHGRSGSKYTACPTTEGEFTMA